MSTLRDGAVQCRLCESLVTGYENRTVFTFHGGERLQLGNSAVLSCGCEVLDYDLEADYTLPGHPTRMVDTLMKTTVLEFRDAGKHNDCWHGSDDDDD